MLEQEEQYDKNKERLKKEKINKDMKFQTRPRGEVYNMENLLVKMLCSSIKNLFDTQPDIFEFTSQSGETEWNLAHHLANEIQKYIFLVKL